MRNVGVNRWCGSSPLDSVPSGPSMHYASADELGPRPTSQLKGTHTQNVKDFFVSPQSRQCRPIPGEPFLLLRKRQPGRHRAAARLWGSCPSVSVGLAAGIFAPAESIIETAHGFHGKVASAVDNRWIVGETPLVRGPARPCQGDEQDGEGSRCVCADLRLSASHFIPQGVPTGG